MQAIVKNFRGIIEAQINISQIALIAGLNGAGKTSIARAVAAAATGKPIPYAKVTKKDCAILLRHGTKTGMAAIGTQEHGSMQIEWPKAEAHSFGTPPVASEIAVGITDLFSMVPKDALAYMIGLLKAEPAIEDLQRSFESSGLENAEKTAAAVWKTIEEKGWDGAHARAKETGQQLKGAWAHVTGTAYGKKKADEWYPADWEDSLLKDDHQAMLAELRQQLEAMIGKSAVNKAEKERLEQLADQLPQFKAASVKAVERLDEAADALRVVEDKLRSLPNPNAKVDYSCPHCEGLVHITAVSGSEYRLTKAEKVDEKALRDARMVHAGLCGEQQRLANEKNAASQVLQEAARNESAAMMAGEALKKMGDAPEGAAPSAIEAIRADIARVELHQQMVTKYHEATKVAGQIGTNQTIIDALDETGIRKAKLSQCLDAFTASYITPLCKDFGIPSVLIDADLNVAMGEVSYPMLSASEQFRVRTALQLAIAMLEKSALVIIDGADILDKASRKNLLTMLMNSKMPAILCMTMNNPGAAPNLALAGIGVTYWVEKGCCRPVIIEERAAA